MSDFNARKQYMDVYRAEGLGAKFRIRRYRMESNPSGARLVPEPTHCTNYRTYARSAIAEIIALAKEQPENSFSLEAINMPGRLTPMSVYYIRATKT